MTHLEAEKRVLTKQYDVEENTMAMRRGRGGQYR